MSEPQKTTHTYRDARGRITRQIIQYVYDDDDADQVEFAIALRQHNMAKCNQCDHFNNDVNTGAPLNPPCGLNRSLSICAWKQAAATGEKQGNGCIWVKKSPNDDEV
jgi:hypothetical protein